MLPAQRQFRLDSRRCRSRKKGATVPRKQVRAGVEQRLGSYETEGYCSKFIGPANMTSGLHELTLTCTKIAHYSYHGMGGPDMNPSKQLGQGNGIGLCSNDGGRYTSHDIACETVARFSGFKAGDSLLFSFDADRRELR